MHSLQTLTVAGVLATTAACLGAAQSSSKRPAPDHPTVISISRPDMSGADAVRHKLEGVVIPSFAVDAMPLEDALVKIEHEFAVHDTKSPRNKRGFSFSIKLPSADSAKADPLSTLSVDTPVTINYQHASIYELLREAARQAGFKVKIETWDIILLPEAENSDPMITLKMHISLENLRNVSRAHPEYNPADSSSRFGTKELLESAGVQFPTESSVVYLAEAHILVVRDTQPNIDAVISLARDAQTGPAPGQPKVISLLKPEKSIADDIRHDMEKNKISYFGVKAMAFDDVISKIQREVRIYDPKTPSRRYGLSFFVEGSSGTPTRPATPVASGASASPASATGTSSVTIALVPITLKLRHISVYDLLRELARQVGYKVVVEPNAVCLFPASENTDPIITMELRISVETLRNISPGHDDLLGSDKDSLRADASSLLESAGVGFPPGASAAYVFGRHVLVVHETAPNIDLIQSLAREAWNALPATRNR